MTKPINLPTGDARLGELAGALTDFIYEKADGLPLPSIIGVLDIVKYQLLKDCYD